ncbi:hypothetical protein QSJ18_14010 [Gordonia sp. ABSL1-1]|uniref:hypothetical protein n=1 Tax=Gordonia sp. ABSL1-1 TaxID=3053923 RepID=UPI002573ED49|nr:hypothetical protein [Gordonia sp. ABSL1-1]MDL9937864.1 hypothetical protein [Gordonia sp. ABSL1-1]
MSLLAGTALAAGTIAGLTVGSAGAAPQGLAIQQAPNIGITVSGSQVTGGFSALLQALPAADQATTVSLDTTKKACATNLRDARVAISWRNPSAGKAGSKVFPACGQATLATGPGRVSFTTTVLGKGDRTFTVTPGSGSFLR